MTCHSAPRLNTTWRSTSCSMEVKKMSARVLISILRACFHPFKDNADDRIRQAGEVIVAVTVAVREDPCSYYLIDSAKEAMRRDGNRHLCPENAGLLAFSQD